MKSVRVVLVEPLGTDFQPTLFTKGNSLEPVALEWLAAYVDKNASAGAYDIFVIQQRPDLSNDGLVDRIAAMEPDVVGFSVRTQYLERCRYVAHKLKGVLPGVLIVVGGQHPSVEPGVVQNDEFDVAVVGEGEITFFEVLETFRSYLEQHADKKQLHTNWAEIASGGEIAGTAYRDGDDIHEAQGRCRVQDFDSLPLPRRDPELIEACRQWNVTYPSPERQRGVAQVSWSRGCSGGCTFCVSPLVWRGAGGCTPVVSRRNELVVDELLRLKKQLGTNYVYFNDLSFNAPAGGHDQLMSFCQALVEAGVHVPGEEAGPDHIDNCIHWFALCKVGITDEEARAMADAGCSKVGIGYESVRPQTVRKYRKQYAARPDQGQETLNNTDRHGIINRVYIIIGSPEDPKSVVRETIDTLLGFPVDQIRLAYFTPYPGTEAWDKYKDQLIYGPNDLSQLTQEQPVVECDLFSVDELKSMRREIAHGFYSDPKYAEHCKQKVERFPWLRDSFNFHFRELERQFARERVQLGMPEF